MEKQLLGLLLFVVHHEHVAFFLHYGARPKFFRPRSVPFAIREAVGEELDRLETAGILEKVSYAEWAAPIVAVPKKDGKFRICGDYKVTINPVLETNQHPLPKPEELFATLADGSKFTKFDLSQAYTQIRLDNTSAGYVTVNTHKGLYKYKRLPYGVAVNAVISVNPVKAVIPVKAVNPVIAVKAGNAVIPVNPVNAVNAVISVNPVKAVITVKCSDPTSEGSETFSFPVSYFDDKVYIHPDNAY